MSFTIGIFGHTISAFFYILMALAIMLRLEGLKHHRDIILACISMLVWSTVISLQTFIQSPIPYIGPLSEIFRSASWIFVLANVMNAHQDESPRVPFPPRFTLNESAALSVAVALIIIVVNSFFHSHSSNNIIHDVVTGIMLTLLCIIGLIFIEQILRNSTQKQSKDVRYLCLGIGSLFTYDFFMFAYSYAFLSGNIETTLENALWEVRGAVAAIACILISITILKPRTFPLRVNLSRQFVFHSGVLIAAGIYLFIMSLFGLYIKDIGDNWGAALQTLFMASAVVLLVTLVFSERLRAQTRVFVSRHLFRYKYDYRVEWTRITRTLSADNETPLPERAIRSIAEIMKSPGGGLWMIDAGTNMYTQVAVYNMQRSDRSHESINSTLIKYLLDKEWVIDLEEYRRAPDLYDGLTLPQWLDNVEQAWIIVPLCLQKELQGFIILRKPRKIVDLNWEDHDLLKTAGRQAASFLAQMSTAEDLIEARQFQAFNRTAAFVVHDLKTVIAQLSLVVKNAARHKKNPQFIDDMIGTIEHSVTKMSHLHQQLRKGNGGHARTEVDLSEVVKQVVLDLSNTEPVPTMTRLEPSVLITADPYQMATVLVHLIQNAQQATDKDGYVNISLHTQLGWARIKIEDNGCGIDSDFLRDKLFKPFESTKGLTGMGIGVYQSREYLKEIGGEIKVASQLNIGTEFNISVPLRSKDVESRGV